MFLIILHDDRRKNKWIQIRNTGNMYSIPVPICEIINQKKSGIGKIFKRIRIIIRTDPETQ
jgi:hypothetical protein